MKKKHSYKLSASIICCNFLEIKKEIRQIEKGEIDYIHFDVMDGIFVPRYGLLPELLRSIKLITDIPINVHMMVVNPESYIDDFAKAGADIITVHVEAQPQLYRIINKIKSIGIKAGIALNPATSHHVLDYLLDEIDLIIMMAINPGVLGQKIIPFAYKKITDIKAKLTNHSKITLEIDGGVTPVTAPKMIQAGANMLVCGTETIFQPTARIDLKIRDLRKTINDQL